MSDTEGKRFISRKIARFTKALHDRGYPHLGTTSYEKNPHLHAHHLVHIPQDLMGRIMSWDQGEDAVLHIRRADRFGPTYITKQRRWMGPEIEDKIADRRGNRRLWEKGSYIPGPRLTFIGDAKIFMAGHARPQIRNRQDTA